MNPVKSMDVLTALLCVAAVAILVPLWAPLVLAAWFADLLQPAIQTFERTLGGRRRAAGALVVLVSLVVLGALAGFAAALSGPMQDFLVQLGAALSGRQSVAAVALGGHPLTVGVPWGGPSGRWAELAGRYGANALGVAAVIARVSARGAMDVLVFVAALYTLAVDAGRARAWLEAQSPISRDAFARLAAAFRETGRGLILGTGGTALVQGALATVAYVSIGVPRALVLGPLTAACALVPLVGTGLVWMPLAVELMVTRHYARGAVVIVMGVVVHSLVDNFLRPVLTRHGRLELPTFIVLLSMLGGVAALGATGALLGPLVVRLCVEALAIQRAQRTLPAV